MGKSPLKYRHSYTVGYPGDDMNKRCVYHIYSDHEVLGYNAFKDTMLSFDLKPEQKKHIQNDTFAITYHTYFLND